MLSNTSNSNLNLLELNYNKMPFNNANNKKALNHTIKNRKKIIVYQKVKIYV